MTDDQKLRGLLLGAGLDTRTEMPVETIAKYIQKLQDENAELKKQVDPMFANHLLELEARLVKSERALESIWKITVNTPSRAVEAIRDEHSKGSQ